MPLPPIHPNFAHNPATGQPFLISEMGPGQLWSAYIRYIGAGAVLASGLITLGRTIPTIISSAVEGMRGFGAGSGARGVPISCSVRQNGVNTCSGLPLLPSSGGS